MAGSFRPAVDFLDVHGGPLPHHSWRVEPPSARGAEVAGESRITRAIDFTHPACANQAGTESHTWIFARLCVAVTRLKTMHETPGRDPSVVRFGVFELDLRSGELRKSGARLNLQQQPLQLLSLLLERPGELVSRDELRRRLWPEDTFVDFEQGVTATVKRVRDTLGDSADSPRFVETLPRKGYRFIAPVSVLDVPAARTESAARLWHVSPAWAIVGAASAVAMALAMWAFLKAPARAPAGHDATSVRGLRGAVVRLTTGSDLNTEPVASPDGEWVAYASDRSGEGHLDIWIQRLSGGEPFRLTRDLADEREPTFSADGSRIAFRSERDGGGIYVIPAYTGGEARLLVRGGAHGPRFSPDGRWLAYSTGPGRFGTDKALAMIGRTYLVPSSGGESRQLLPDFVAASWPVWSPDSHHLLLTARRDSTQKPEWWVVALDGQAPTRIAIDVIPGEGLFPVRAWSWIEGNRIVYSSLGGDSWNLWEVAITPGTWVIPSEPKRLTTAADLQAHASVQRSTQLVFSSLTQAINVWSVPISPNIGRVMGPAQKVTATSTLQWWPSASDDGRRLVFRGDKLAARGFWMRDLESDREVLLVASRAVVDPVITADGSRIAYWSFEKNPGIYTVPTSGGVPERLCGDCGEGWASVEDWSGDNRRLLYETGSPSALFVLDLGSGTKRLVLQRTPNSVWEARFSPDDRWISVLETFPAEERTQLWIVPSRDGSIPDATEWVAVTSGEHWDDKPRWSPDGNLLYFTSLRDGFHCFWAQRLQPDTKQPIGPAFPVHHLHSARLSLTNTGFAGLDVAVTRDKILVNLGELSGNIWTTLLQ